MTLSNKISMKSDFIDKILFYFIVSARNMARDIVAADWMD